MNEIEMAIDAIGVALAQEPPAAIEQGYGFYLVIWQCEKWNEPYPRKVRIAENCKLARRILLDITKESDGST